MTFDRPAPVVGRPDQVVVRWEEHGGYPSHGSLPRRPLATAVTVPPQTLPPPPLAEVLAAAVRLGVTQAISNDTLPFGLAKD